jgi:hypothetical protein
MGNAAATNKLMCEGRKYDTFLFEMAFMMNL